MNINHKVNRPDTARKVAATLVIILFSFSACKNGNSLEMAAFSNTIDSLKHLNDQTVSMLGASQIKIDEVSSEKHKLDSMLANKDKEIARLRKDVDRLKKTNKKLAHAKKPAASDNKEKEMAGYVEMYQSQIKQLKAEKDALAAELATLRASFDRIKKLGSLVYASNFRIDPVKLKKGGKVEKPVTKAKKMNELKVSFDLEPNQITDDGNKTLYIVITGPDGKVLSDNSNLSGKFAGADGAMTDYTVKKDIMVHNGKPVNDLSCSWKQTGSHEKGTYAVAVYNEGHRVGAGSVMLK